ncbi:MAG TPA: PadR family transcriptional regulator [Bryobacteraceae bacterium]|jgi:transcriptional regulator|nr:PadR family transcriptional regulator [Bryobacteraceae bacterium]
MSRHEEKGPSEAELLQGTLDMLILKVVAGRPIHGYAIVQRIQQLSREALQIRQGSLYPALYRLEKRGWLKAEWKTTEGGRDAKYYSLTRAGQRQLEAETAGWKRLCEAISLVLETATE